IALLQKAGFEVIEIPVNRLLNQDLMKPYIDQIKARIGIPPQEHGSVSLKEGGQMRHTLLLIKAGNPQIMVT
ncbi:hypothetical protein, partial [Endozoicomonas acroporae]|uniref:hypothetical protein n=1 Tax=Endozoicomonas acroporae TaxID=1701104 RepID=UPI003D7A2942